MTRIRLQDLEDNTLSGAALAQLKALLGISGSSEAFPVGSIFISAVATDPATLLGYGTWSAIGAGRVLVGQDTNDTDFASLGETGGAKTVAAAGANSAPTFTGNSVASDLVSAGTPAGAVSQPTFTGSALGTHQHTYTDVPNHTHPHNLQGSTTGATTGTNVMASTSTGGSARAMAIATSNPTGGVATGTTAAVSAGTPAGTVSQPTFTGSALGTHQHHTTATGSVSAPAFTGTPTSVVQPYLVVKLWQRTA